MTSFDMPDDYEGSGGFLDGPGTFHIVVTEVKEGQGPSGKAAECDTFVFHVLAGTNKDQVGKQHSEAVFAPKLTSKDGGAFQRKQIARLYIALGLVDPSARGKSVDVEVGKSVDRQMIVKIGKDNYNSERLGRDVFNVDGLGFFHVDDPMIEGVPKDVESLKLIPSELRHNKAWFDQLKSKDKPAMAGAGAGGASSGSGGGKGTSVNLDDL